MSPEHHRCVCLDCWGWRWCHPQTSSRELCVWQWCPLH